MTSAAAPSGAPAPLVLEELLSPAWLSFAVGSRYPGVSVSSAEVVETLQTIATKVRFRVEYDAEPDPAVPRSLCVKGYFSPEMRSRVGTGTGEAHFYRELAPDLGVRVPPCVYVGMDEQTGHGVVLMEDLVADGATFLTPLSPVSLDHVKASLDQLALLHARHWADSWLSEPAWLDSRTSTLTSYVSVERLQQMLDGPRGERLSPATRRAERLHAGLDALVARSGGRPACLVHGDAHAGNIFVTAEGRPGLIDWQLVQRGRWAVDVAYHLGALLEPEDRARCERDLLLHYLDRLATRGAPAPDWDEAWWEYRVSLVYGYFLWGITQKVAAPVTEAFVTRLGLAVEEHDSFGLLGV